MFLVRDYNKYYQSILDHGETRYPRGMSTVGVWDTNPVFRTGWFPRRPKDNPAIGIIEGLQFIAGKFDKDAIISAAPGAKHELFTHQSAYGPRVGEQFERILWTLQDDPESRRAQLIIADPSDNPGELPCTTSMLFRIENGNLYTTVHMRSSDAVWGLPYDLIQFGMVSSMLAACLRLKAATTSMMIADAHIYHDHMVTERWTSDYLVMPNFTSLRLWQKWASQIVAARLSREELENRFIASKVLTTEEDVYAHAGGGLS